MTGWCTIGYLLGWASLPNWESGSLLVMLGAWGQQLQRGSVSLEGDLGSGLHFCVLSARAHTCGLGTGLNKSDRVDGTSGWLVSQ